MNIQFSPHYPVLFVELIDHIRQNDLTKKNCFEFSKVKGINNTNKYQMKYIYRTSCFRLFNDIVFNEIDFINFEMNNDKVMLFIDPAMLYESVKGTTKNDKIMIIITNEVNVFVNSTHLKATIKTKLFQTTGIPLECHCPVPIVSEDVKVTINTNKLKNILMNMIVDDNIITQFGNREMKFVVTLDCYNNMIIFSNKNLPVRKIIECSDVVISATNIVTYPVTITFDINYMLLYLLYHDRHILYREYERVHVFETHNKDVELYIKNNELLNIRYNFENTANMNMFIAPIIFGKSKDKETVTHESIVSCDSKAKSHNKVIVFDRTEMNRIKLYEYDENEKTMLELVDEYIKSNEGLNYYQVNNVITVYKNITNKATVNGWIFNYDTVVDNKQIVRVYFKKNDSAFLATLGS